MGRNGKCLSLYRLGLLPCSLARFRLAGAAAISKFWPLYLNILQSEFYGSNLSLTDSVTPPVITPPPTPVNRFLASVSSSKRNQIHVCIPRYILRGLGRDSYHVFEVKVKHFFRIVLVLCCCCCCFSHLYCVRDVAIPMIVILQCL